MDIITCIKTTFAQNIDKLFANWISRVKQLIHNHIFVEKKKKKEEKKTKNKLLLFYLLLLLL